MATKKDTWPTGQSRGPGVSGGWGVVRGGVFKCVVSVATCLSIEVILMNFLGFLLVGLDFP